MILILAYIGCIVAANYFVGHIGTVCIQNGPCLIPVLPGVLAPSGVLLIGAALLLRDLVQRRYGPRLSLICIALGAAASFAVSQPSIAIASAAAFTFSELADFAVYTPLARRWFAAAVLLSCTAGAVVDSGIFLWLAFGNLEHVVGQIIGKLYAGALFATWTWLRNRNDKRLAA